MSKISVIWSSKSSRSISARCKLKLLWCCILSHASCCEMQSVLFFCQLQHLRYQWHTIVTPFVHCCVADQDIGWLLMVSRITCGSCRITSAEWWALQSVLCSTEVINSSNVVPWVWRMFKMVLICKSGSGTGIGTYQSLNLKTNLNLD